MQKVFQATTITRAVYYFAEIDIIGLDQLTANEIGERGQVLNSFLAMVGQDHSHSILIASTSHADIPNIGFVGYFDDVLQYEFPSEWQIARLLETRLKHMAVEGTNWRKLAALAVGLSYSDVSAAANDALKSAIIYKLSKLHDSDINATLSERKSISEKINACTIPGYE